MRQKLVYGYDMGLSCGYMEGDSHRDKGQGKKLYTGPGSPNTSEMSTK